VPSDPLGNPLPDSPVVRVDTTVCSTSYAKAQSQWEDLFMIGASQQTQSVGQYDATFRVQGRLGPSTNTNGTGQARMVWSLRDFNHEQLIYISAGYHAAIDAWSKYTYSDGVWEFDWGTGPLVIDESLRLNGGTFQYGTPLYLNSLLRTYVSGNGVSSFGNTVGMTEFEVPSGSLVYAYSGTDLAAYGIVFDGMGGGTLCHDLACASGTGGVGTVVPAIPEPEAYAMMLAGLGLIAFVVRRRST